MVSDGFVEDRVFRYFCVLCRLTSVVSCNSIVVVPGTILVLNPPSLFCNVTSHILNITVSD